MRLKRAWRWYWANAKNRNFDDGGFWVTFRTFGNIDEDLFVTTRRELWNLAWKQAK